MNQHLAVCVAAMLALAGCAGDLQPDPRPGANTLIQDAVAIGVSVDTKGELFARDRVRLNAMLSKIPAKTVDRVVVEQVYAYTLAPTARTKDLPSHKRSQQQWRKLFSGYGIEPETVAFTYDSAPRKDNASPHNTKITVHTTEVALAPQCAGLGVKPFDYYLNLPSRDFGCATRASFGQMIDRPRDMVEGAPDAAPDAERNILPVMTYKAGGAPAAASSSSQ